MLVGAGEARRGSGVVSGLGDSKFIGKAIERAVIWGMFLLGLVFRAASDIGGSSLGC